MRVKVELYGVLREHTTDGKAAMEVEVAPGTTVGQLVAQVGVAKEEPWLASLDGKLVDDDTPLCEGCRLVVFPPMEGGQD